MLQSDSGIPLAVRREMSKEEEKLFYERMSPEFLKTYELLKAHREVFPSASGSHWLHV